MKRLLVRLFICAAVCATASGQTDWQKRDTAVLLRGSAGQWDAQFLSGPYVVRQGSTYHMWFGGYDGATGSQIGYASSTDGLNWVKADASNPILLLGAPGSWDAVSVYQPCVFFDGSGYRMWFGGHDGTVRQIGYATSPDSIHWTKHPQNPVLTPGAAGTWDDGYVDSPEVLFVDGVFHMWYSGFDGTVTQIGHATSPDGIVWTKDTLNPVLAAGSGGSWDAPMTYQPSVLYDGKGSYHMWYSGGAAFLWSIGYASSSDGVNWTKHGAPVIAPGSAGKWDDAYVGLCGVRFNEADSSQFVMWFSGGDAIAAGDIGFASSLVSSVSDNSASALPTRFELLQNYPNPFNPTTEVRYQMTEARYVTLDIFNVLGQRVTRLVDEEKRAGTWIATWDASGMTSGLYFYRLVAISVDDPSKRFVDVKKMVLLR